MPSVDSQAGTQAQRHISTVHLNQDLQQSQSSNSEPSDTSILTSQRQDSDNTTPHSSYHAIRNNDRQRYAAGERPGPNWKDVEAMKAWLEQRFPQGTQAGSPYYQFMIAASGFEDTYWTPGRGSEAVVGKFSESEWKRWTKEKAGLVMHSSWGQDPLYPDAKRVKAQAAFGDTAGSSSSSQPLTEEGYSQIADVDRFLDGIENTRVPSARASSRMEGHLHGNSYGLEKSHSSSKRTVVDAELDAQDPSAWKRFKRSNSAKLSQMAQSILEKDSSSKKRTASDAETEADESPCAKRVKQFSGTTSPFHMASSPSNSLTTRRDKTIKNITHAPRSMLPPLENKEVETVEHNSLSEFRSFGNHDDVVAEYNHRSNLRKLVGQGQEGEGEEEEDDHDVNDEVEEEHLSNTAPSKVPKTPQAAQTSTSTAPHRNTPQPPCQHLVRVLIPAPPAPPKVLPLPPKTPSQKTPLKKRLPTSAPPLSQPRYFLRSSIKKRRHTLPRFVHLGMKGRKEIQIAGCIGF